MKNTWLIILGIILIVGLGIFVGYNMVDSPAKEYNTAFDNNMSIQDEMYNDIIIEVSNREEEVTTPNTLIIYKTYYAKCKHYVQEYKDIDASLVNLKEDELKEKSKGWKVDKFSSQEIEMSREVNKFCNQHYKIKLEI